MKLVLNTLLIFTFLFSISCSQEKEVKETLASSELKVEGMVCAVGCAKTIEKEMLEMEGVKSCSVNFDEGVASITFNENLISNEKIMDHISHMNDGQYKVELISTQQLSQSNDNSTGNSSKKSLNETEIKPSFELPNLFTYLINKI
jgi:copper chaperone CopZ